MTTLDESRAALAAADAQMRNAAQLASCSLPVLVELLDRIGDEGSDALRNLSDSEALAVGGAIALTISTADFGRARREYEREVAESN